MLWLFVADVVVCNAGVCAFRVVDRLVLIHRVRVAGDDVPGVDQARDVAKTAEGDVDERVGCAEANFDPYC
jgi:hypothetical protein